MISDRYFLFHNSLLTTVFVKTVALYEISLLVANFSKERKFLDDVRNRIESFHSRVTTCDANTFKRLFRNYRNARVNNEKVGGK